VAFPLREQRDWTEAHIEEIVYGLLDLLEIRELADSVPAELSTGMKRAAAIARALAARPDAVLYDEPTTMVDPLMSQHIGDLIRKLKYQLRLNSVVVTHDRRLAQKLADRIVFLEGGRAIFFGTNADLSASTDPFIQEFMHQDELASSSTTS